MEIYLVGGAVRDELLGLPIKERDWVVVGATPQAMLDQGYQPVGKDFPVFLHPETHEEYALARTERKSGQGYKGFNCYAAPDVTLEDDLLRRDLTINAIAKSNRGEIIDPYGGQEDLKNKVLRHVSPAFIEDPLRILRVARFKARFFKYDFRIAEPTHSLMLQLVRSGELTSLVAERVWQELDKVLALTHPEEFFMCLRRCGALEKLFPELDNLFGVPNPSKWHPEIDSGVHSMMVLQAAAKLSDKKTIRFAALVHDLGKAVTDPNHWPSHHGHDERGVSLINDLCDRYRVPNEYRDLAQKVAQYHGKIHKSEAMRPETLLSLLDNLDAWRRYERLVDSVLCCKADSQGRTGFHDKPYPQEAYLLGAVHVAEKVVASSFVEQGLQGEAIGKALRGQRLVEITNYIKLRRST